MLVLRSVKCLMGVGVLSPSCCHAAGLDGEAAARGKGTQRARLDVRNGGGSLARLVLSDQSPSVCLAVWVHERVFVCVSVV
ncbi:uncharacterized protein UV8b_04789 [Ustilaginoidea virens]|uniref:Secreted protein n=1 Tax=Ustilaginoidea virens TaxID=1159556 RepID=A0A8E5HS78_USTVR|nr:uncharacterized protein UV8b_04789 [Ustilaginoidea virens]QUC20548.1 hypothetical protein UV8b_04789 [Ustilaginoidea virens]